MLVGVVSAILIAGAGFATLQLLGIGRTAVSIGLAPAAGIALLAVISTWGLQVGVPEVVTGLTLVCVCLVGLAFVVRDGVLRLQTRPLGDRVTAMMLLAALLSPIIVIGQAFFVQAGVPGFAYDGPHHVEMVDSLRHGSRLAGLAWYPTGFHAPAAALLSLVPALDSAAGVVDWAVGLTLLAPLGMVGFATAVWRDIRVGAASALVLALTLAYPYDPHLYSLWPMGAALLIVVGLWTTTIAYFEQPSPRLVVLGALLAGGLLLIHGTEVYSAAIGLVALAAAHWKRAASWRVAVHTGLALVLALLLAASYLPQAAGWTTAGGAVPVGVDYFDVRRAALTDNPLAEAAFWAESVSSGLLMDFPVRVALIAVGAWVAFSQRTARVLVVLAVLFTALVAIVRHVDAPVVRAVFALTLPWAVDDRLIMMVPIVTASLGGAGVVWLGRALATRLRECGLVDSPSHLKWRWRARMALALGLATGLATVFVLAAIFRLQTSQLVTYSADDAAALAWLDRHAQPGDVVMNDGAADAGIWAPYKANVSIVLPHTRVVASDGPEELVRTNLGELDTRSDVRRAACLLRVDYVYRGEANSPEVRQFPGLDELRHTAALEEIFSSGQAAIFRTHLGCTG